MNRNNWFYRFKADVDWLENHVEDIEQADRQQLLALTSTTGVASGYVVTEKDGGQNFSVDVSAGVAYDPAGRRVYNDDSTNVPFTTDINGDPIAVSGGGNQKIVSVYAQYALLDDPASATVDGFGDTVFTITNETVSFRLVQGTAAPAGTAVAAADPGGGYIRLADVTISTGDSTIANADIDESVKAYLGFAISPNAVGDGEIDWGLGAGQVSAVDVPIEDAGGYYGADNVEAALQALGLSLSSFTGTGSWVKASSPTIVTPTIASFTNATHNHQNAAGGGSLDAAAIGSGTLPVARGGTGVTTSTGTGSVVLSSSPTIVTPTIASLTNMQHNHQNAAGGGSLDAAAIGSGTLPVARGGTGVTSSTGTGSVVLSASPTFTGTVNGAALTLSGNLIAASGSFSSGNVLCNGNGVYSVVDDPPATINFFGYKNVCRAWVVWDDSFGIRMSQNVSSVTDDDGDGYYHVNYSVAIPGTGQANLNAACFASTIAAPSSVANACGNTTGVMDVYTYNTFTSSSTDHDFAAGAFGT